MGRQERVNTCSVVIQDSCVSVEYDEVVDVTYIVFYFQDVLDVLVELVQVNVREELARPVPQWHPFPRDYGFVVVENATDEREETFVRHFPS